MGINYMLTPVTVSLAFASVNLMKGKSMFDVKEKIKVCTTKGNREGEKRLTQI